jgi:hypothetical protein
MILVKILAPGFYARQNVVTPVRIGIVTLVATQAMNFAFVGPLKHAGLALAIGLGAASTQACSIAICARTESSRRRQVGRIRREDHCRGGGHGRGAALRHGRTGLVARRGRASEARSARRSRRARSGRVRGVPVRHGIRLHQFSRAAAP